MRWKGEAGAKGIRRSEGDALFWGSKAREGQKVEGKARGSERRPSSQQAPGRGAKPQEGQFGGGHRGEQLKSNEAEAC